MSDNGPQYASQEFANFANSYNFSHVTSSPHFPQSNGHAERAVQTMKRVLKDSSDPYTALLCYRTTPLPWCDISPAELLMGRKLRTNLPQLTEHLSPKWPDLESFRQSDHQFKAKQKENFDRRHGARSLTPLPDDSEVWVTTDDQTMPGRVVTPADAPRSYLVDTPHSQVRRNRRHLNPRAPTDETPAETSDPTPSPIMTRSRTGTTVRPPDRY